MLKIGQIGIGHNHGAGKMRAIRKFPELFEVIGYAEENEQWVAQRGQLEAYQGLKRLTVEEVIDQSDAILVETDVLDLTATAQKCIDAGKHIHLDKPASGTLAEYKHLLDSAKEKNLVVQLGYMYRYNPPIQKLFEMVRSGELGTIYAINAEMSRLHDDEYRQWLRHFPGGNMYIFGCHLIDLILSLLGEPKQVFSQITQSGLHGIHAPDLTAATLLYDHAIARVFVSSVECNGWGRRCFSVAGSEGTLEIRPLEEPVCMTFATVGNGKEERDNYARELEAHELPRGERYDEMMKDFHDFVLGYKENPYTYEHEYMVQKVLWEACAATDTT